MTRVFLSDKYGSDLHKAYKDAVEKKNAISQYEYLKELEKMIADFLSINRDNVVVLHPNDVTDCYDNEIKAEFYLLSSHANVYSFECLIDDMLSSVRCRHDIDKAVKRIESIIAEKKKQRELDV